MIANRYEVRHLLGEGGMGKVYQVWDTLNQQEVALKILSQKIASDDAFLKFKQEFWFMTKLRHPHIVHVYDYGVLDDRSPYITMEMVKGKALNDLTKPDYPLIYQILIQTAKALGFIHSRLLVHCDIKPENLFLQPDGYLKLMDFGLMQQLGSRSSGQISGTVAYLPPEIPKGGVINESSDLYSLGILAYELITGVQPFIGKTVLDIVKAHINRTPPPMHTFRKNIPKKLDTIVMKLIAKEQDKRYQSAAELLLDLAEASGLKITESISEKRSYISSHVLVGREHELTTLKQGLEATRTGQHQSMFIFAPAGVGKSRLIEEFKLHAQLSEVPFCEGICVEQGMSSYEPIAHALACVIPLTEKEYLEEIGPILISLLPELKRLNIQPLSGFDPKVEKLRLFECVTTWLKCVSTQKPLVLFIDDLHWADLASLELLNHLIREMDDARVLLIGSFRDDEVPPNSPLWQTVEEKLTAQIQLKLLTQSQLEELIQKMLVHVDLKPHFITHLYGITSGNAFFLTEVLRYLVEENLLERTGLKWRIPEDFSKWELPTSIGDTIRHRLKRLSIEAKELIELCAVVGKEIPLSLLERLSGQKEQMLFTILEELVERQFLNREESTVLFPHDRVRETLYHQISETRRQTLHQKVGNWQEEQGNYSVAQLAHHFKHGTDRVKAFQYLLKAGEAASVRMEQSQLLKEGLDILEKLEIPDKNTLLETYQRKLAWISYMIHPWNCITACEQLLAVFQNRQTALEKQVEFESILISSYTMIGQNDKALKRAEKLMTQMEAGSLPHALILFGRLNALLTRGELRQLVNDMEVTASILKQHLPELSRQMIWTYAFCCFIRDDAVAWLGEPLSGSSYTDVPRSTGQKHHFLDLVFWSYYPQIVRWGLTGHYQEIKKLQDELMNMVKKMGRPIQHENRFKLCLAFAAIEHGELAEGETLATQIVTRGEQLQNPHQQASGKILQGMLARQRGQLDEAIIPLAEAVELSRKSQTDQLIPALYRLADVHMQKSEWNQAEPLLEEAHALATSKPLENPYHQIHTHRLKGHLAQNKGNEDALSWLQKSLQIAQRTENPIQCGFSHQELGDYWYHQQEIAKAKEHYEKALATFSEVSNSQQTAIRQRLEELQTEASRLALASSSLDQNGIEIPPERAQEIGYRFVKMLEEMKLPQFPAVAVEGDRQALSERLEKVEKVNQFSQLIMQSLDLQLTLKRILDYVLEIAQADRGCLMLVNEEGELSTEVVRIREGDNQEQMMAFSRSFTARVLQTGESLWIKDAQMDAEFSQQASIMALDLRTIICVPLKTEGQVFGLLYLDRQAVTQTFSQEDLELVESMAIFATISLVNARLHNQVREKNQRLEMLNDLSKVLSTTIEFSELLNMVLSFCLSVTRGEIGYIFLSKERKGRILTFQELNCEIGRDSRGNALPEVTVSHSIIQRVLERGEPLCLVDSQQDEDFSTQQSVMALELRSVMCVPIQNEEQHCFGVVYISSQAVNRCFTSRDLALMEAVIRQVGLAIDNRHLVEIRKKQELLEKELNLARNIQTSMLPDFDPEIVSLDVSGYSEPAAALGGDYFDYFKISDSEFGLAIGDVNGHGISASLLMAMAKSCLFVQGKEDPSVSAMLGALNDMVYGGTKERLFMTFIYSIFDLDNQNVTFASAGHHLPYHYSDADKSLRPIDIKAVYPLGVREQIRISEVTLGLKPNDVLLYYTDGIVEARNRAGEEFGFERLENLLVSYASQPSAVIKRLLLDAYHRWLEGQPPEDDMTLVVVKVKPIKPETQAESTHQKIKTGFLTLIKR